MQNKRSTLILAIIALFISSSASAQTFLIDDPDPSYYITYSCSDFDANFNVRVTNIGASTIDVNVMREVISAPVGHENAIGWNQLHYVPTVDVGVAQFVLPMAPGDTSRSFEAWVFPDNIPGTDVIRYCFFDQNNPADSNCIIVTYECLATSVIEQPDELGTFSELFPNPASDQVSIAFNINPSASSAEMVVYDAQGRLIDQMKLNSFNGVQAFGTANLDNGLYFMQVRVDGIVSARRQFVVSH